MESSREHHSSTQGKQSQDGHRYRRRMSDHRLDQLADSAILKVFQYVVTAIAVPVIGWSLNAVLDRLAKIETALNVSATQFATFELRVAALERVGIERDAAIKMLTEQALRHSYQIQRLEESRSQTSRK